MAIYLVEATKLRKSIVLRDEIVAEIWRKIPATCREPVDDDPNSLLILKQALDNINLADEDKAYVMAGDWGFIPKIRSRREYRRYVKAYEQLDAKLTAALPEHDDPKYDELFVAQTQSPVRPDFRRGTPSTLRETVMDISVAMTK